MYQEHGSRSQSDGLSQKQRAKAGVASPRPLLLYLLLGSLWPYHRESQLLTRLN